MPIPRPTRTARRRLATRLGSWVLALVVSVAAVAPAVPMASAETGHDMPCCAQPGSCHEATLSGVCCQAAPADSTPTAGPAAPAGAAPKVTTPSWAEAPSLPEPARWQAARAFASVLLTLTHDPPFLLNASFLI